MCPVLSALHSLSLNMLLRTASTPVLRPSPSPETDPPPSRISVARHVSLPLSPANKIHRTASVEADLFKGLPLKPRKPLSGLDPAGHSPAPTEDVANGAAAETGPLLLSCLAGAVEENSGLLVGGGAGDGGGGGWEWGGRGSESLDVHYRSLIESYPGDALLLGNYALFLKEVRGDIEKAEEYCARAILATQGNESLDGIVLSLYGHLVWKKHNDAPRANDYFNQAIQSSPDDCYVLASYARFLWDSGEYNEEEEEEAEVEKKLHISNQTY